MSHPAPRVLAIQWLPDKINEPIIALPIGPWKILTEFLIDTGAQMSVITNKTAQLLGIKSTRCKVKFMGIDGVIKTCPTAKITLWLPGEQRMTKKEVLVGAAPTNILGFDLLHGRVWKLPNGTVWSFARHEKGLALSLLETSIPLPPSKITNVRQYPLPTTTLTGIDGLEKRNKCQYCTPNCRSSKYS